MKRFRVLILILCAALVLSSCGDTTTEETETTDTEVTATEDVAPAVITIPSTEATSEETTAETVDNVVAKGFGAERFKSYRDYATQLHNENPDLRFYYEENYEYKPLQFNLCVFDPEWASVMIYYCSDMGEMQLLETYTVENPEALLATTNSYETFMNMPLMMSGAGSNDNFVGSIDDGRYFGSIIAFNESATKMLVSVGTPITMTKDELLSLKEGDKVEVGLSYLDYITVKVVNTSAYGSDRIVFDTSYVVDGETLYADIRLEVDPYPDGSDYIFMIGNENPLAKDYKVVELTVSPDCEISEIGFASVMIGGEFADDMKEFIDEQGYTTVLSKTITYYYAMELDDFKRETSNGWFPVYGLLYPVCIENGQVTKMWITAR